MTGNTPHSTKSFLAGLATATAASLCCITPLLALVGGAGSVASSFSWIEPFRPYLVGLTIIAFGFAWYQQLKPRKAKDCCDVPSKASFFQSKTFLSIVTVAAGLMLAFPYYAKALYPVANKQAFAIVDKHQSQEVVFKITGMTCEGCTEHIHSALAKVNGVYSYQASYDSAQCKVVFDKSQTNIDSITSAINSTGYTVIAHH